jgi:quercetin dioxygenase-like cupin family protein
MRPSLIGAGTALALAVLSLQSLAGDPLAIRDEDPQLQWGPCPPFFSSTCRLAVLQGDPAKPNADVFFRLEGGDPFPLHTHTSAERMVLVSGELVVEYTGHPAVTLVPGTYAYGPASAPHQGQCVSVDACVLFIAFEEPVDAFAVE